MNIRYHLPILGGPSAEMAMREGFSPFIDFIPDDYEPGNRQKLDLARLNARIKAQRWTA